MSNKDNIEYFCQKEQIHQNYSKHKKWLCYFTISYVLLPQVDKFTIEAVDLGEVYKIKIYHDNSMVSADWYLDQVEVVDVDTEEVFLFLCERWLSRKREDRRIERVFYVKVVWKTSVCDGF